MVKGLSFRTTFLPLSLSPTPGEAWASSGQHPRVRDDPPASRRWSSTRPDPRPVHRPRIRRKRRAIHPGKWRNTAIHSPPAPRQCRSGSLSKNCVDFSYCSVSLWLSLLRPFIWETFPPCICKFAYEQNAINPNRYFFGVYSFRIFL